MSLFDHEELNLSLTEIIERVGTTEDIVFSMVHYEIIQPKGKSPDTWQFTAGSLHRLEKALRLQRDLELNIPGVAVTLELVDEVERLKMDIARLEHLVNLHCE
jgi:chaperone modulatory protein CbpM